MFLDTSSVFHILRTVLTVAEIAALVIILISALFGIRRGAAKSGWKLFCRILAIGAAFGCTFLLYNVFKKYTQDRILERFTPMLLSVTEEVLPGQFPAERFLRSLVSTDLADLLMRIVYAIAAPVIFYLLYLLIGFLFLIPKIIIWRKAIRPALERKESRENDASYAKDKEETKKRSKSGRYPLAGVLISGVSAAVLMAVLLMPLASLTSAAADTVKALDSSGILTKMLGEEGISGTVVSSIDRPVLRAVDRTAGRLLYRPLISVKTASGRVDILEEVSSAVRFGGEFVLSLANAGFTGGKTEPDLTKLAEADPELIENSSLLPELAASVLRSVFSDEALTKEIMQNVPEEVQGFTDPLVRLLGNVTGEDLKRDAGTLFAAASDMIDFAESLPGENIYKEDLLPALKGISTDALGSAADRILENEHLKEIMDLAAEVFAESSEETAGVIRPVYAFITGGPSCKEGLSVLRSSAEIALALTSKENEAGSYLADGLYRLSAGLTPDVNERFWEMAEAVLDDEAVADRLIPGEEEEKIVSAAAAFLKCYTKELSETPLTETEAGQEAEAVLLIKDIAGDVMEHRLDADSILELPGEVGTILSSGHLVRSFGAYAESSGLTVELPEGSELIVAILLAGVDAPEENKDILKEILRLK